MKKTSFFGSNGTACTCFQNPNLSIFSGMVSSQRRLTFYYNINCPNVKDFRSWNCKIVKNELKFITDFAQIAQKICQILGV